MRAYASLRRRGDFARVHRRGRRSGGRLLTVLVSEGSRTTRVGVTVSTAVGGAVVRNLVKRRVKAILDTYPLGAPPYRDIVVIARPGSGEAAFAELATELAGAFASRP